MNKKEQIEFLSRYEDFWGHLSEEEKEFVCRNTETVTYHPGQNVHSADIRCVGVLFVKKGCLRVYRRVDRNVCFPPEQEPKWDLAESMEPCPRQERVVCLYSHF